MHAPYRFIVGCLLALATTAKGHDYSVLVYDSTPRDIMLYSRASQFISGSDTLFVDGSASSLPTGSVTYDRTLYNSLRVGGTYQASANLAFRPMISGLTAFRKEEGKSEPRKIAEEIRTELRPSISMTYITQAGPEVVFGLDVWALNAFERNTETDVIKTVESYGAVSIKTPYMAVVKRGSNFDGGFFYRLGAEKSRSVNIVNSHDGNELEFRDIVQDPTTVGLFTRFRYGGGEMGVLFNAVEAGAGGPRTDDGDTVYEDYLRFQVDAKYSLGPITAAFAVAHKTISYSDNRNVTLSSIPLTAFHARAYLGSATTHTFLGIMAANGKDAQSLPEFNASYKLTALGGSIGLNLGF